MDYQIKLSEDAERDLQTAKCFYRAKNIESAFDQEFIKAMNYLRINPHLFQLYYRTIRKVHFETFKYSIHYVIDQEAVLILRILHQKQFL
jgi:plasmid stabilization system protein ParE